MRILKAQEIKLKRRSAGSYVDGVWVNGIETSRTIKASVQPATHEQLLNLPEAQRTKSTLAIFTTEALNTVNLSNKISADRIEYNGETYEVQQVSPWVHRKLGHYEVLAVKADFNESNRKPQ